MEVDGHTFFFSVAAGVALVMLIYDMFDSFVRSIVREVLQEEMVSALAATKTKAVSTTDDAPPSTA